MGWRSIFRRRQPEQVLSDLDLHKLRSLLARTNEAGQPNINPVTLATWGIDSLSLNVKAMGYSLARSLAAALPPAVSSGARRVGLESKLSTQADVESDWFAHWCSELKIPFLYHRKLWELAYALQALFDHGMLDPGRRGLGFGSGTEPFASYFASRGVDVLITDLPQNDARAKAWSATNQHASIEKAYHGHLTSRQAFDRHVSYRDVDMNVIPDDLRNFDFCWSLCAFEHLGTIRRGLDFVENALDVLRPGGVAVHTTEFNVNPLGPTTDNWATVLFQQQHIVKLAAALEAKGHKVARLNFDKGDRPLDYFIDVPPGRTACPKTSPIGLDNRAT